MFVLGKELEGNRQAVVYEDGEEYGMYDDSAVVSYTSQTARFPYEA